jgi:hypothetical protein
VFDFTKVRNISKKIVIEDDPAKIDRYLARLHATVTKEMQSGRTTKPPNTVKPNARPAQRLT